MAQENSQLELAEILLQRACQVAKDIALHQQSNIFVNYSLAETQERQNLFWTLFVIDKSMSLTTGSPCCLMSIDGDIAIPEESGITDLNDHFVARIKLAHIQEQIYTTLHSPTSRQRSDADHQLVLHQLTQSLQRWYEGHERMITPAPDSLSSTDTFIDDKLIFSFFSSRIMITRQSRNQMTRRQCLEESRKSIRLLKKLHFARSSGQREAVLKQPFQCFPFPGFFEIFVNLIWYPTSSTTKEDLATLRSAIEVLQDISKDGKESTYYFKMMSIAIALTDIASDFVKCFDSGLRLPSTIDATSSVQHTRTTTPSQAAGTGSSSPILTSHRHFSSSTLADFGRQSRPGMSRHNTERHIGGDLHIPRKAPLFPVYLPKDSENIMFASPIFPDSGNDSWPTHDHFSSDIMDSDSPEIYQHRQGLSMNLDSNSSIEDSAFHV